MTVNEFLHTSITINRGHMAEESTTTRPANAADGAEAARTERAATTSRRPRVRRRRGRGWFIAALLFVVVLIVIIVATNSGGSDATMVDVSPVTERQIIQTVTATGVVEPETQVVVSPEVSGEIIYLGVEEGDKVHKGQTIVRINPDQSIAQLDQAQASIAAAKARAAQSSASLTRAKQDLARVRQLHEKQLATDQELEQAQTTEQVNSAELDAARYQVQQAEASYRQYRDAVSKTTITAPLTGTVTQLNSKLGEKVVGAIQMTGTQIMTISDLSVIEVVVDVAETDVVQVRDGDEATVEIDAIPNETFRGTVTQIANSPKASNVGTQEQLTTFPVRIRLEVPDPRLRPGMTATATIETARKSNVLSVPIQSVTTRRPEDSNAAGAPGAGADEEGPVNVRLQQTSSGASGEPVPIVFVVDKGRAVSRVVQTGIRDDQYIEVKGLAKGDQVVSGPYKAISKDLSDGDPVRVEEPSGSHRTESQ